MLIIGHRGAAGLAPENTLESLTAGMDAGADILEFDIRITADHKLVLAHDTKLYGLTVRKHTLTELQAAGIVTLFTDILDAFFGKIILNVELKHEDSAVVAYSALRRYITEDDDWDTVIFSSFKPKALRLLRQRSRKVNLALLQHANQFSFALYHRELDLTAVGFHRLFANALAVATAKELGLFTYAYTVNRPATAARLSRRGIDGIVTDYPQTIAKVASAT